ncbi:DUF1885 family protein [Bacillus massiliigorillae]|uniref:DUF1885 family protein n=1 Tax=Bacillus massiliigorillae TaxID=1243664 RepID=UPI00039EF902|nr:DUF1885 family protein [Bacillus massiliigorillae]
MSTNVNAYIKLTPASTQQTITIDEVKNLLLYYKEITTKTGEQVDWNYSDFAFPYQIKETPEGNNRWFYLSSNNERYNIIMIGIDQESIKEADTNRIQTYIQVTLPEVSTFGDKAKANEFCKFLSKKLKGELHLFNKRIIYHYPRK